MIRISLYGYRIASIFVTILFLGVAGYVFLLPKSPIKIGILHSITGDLASIEKPMVEAELLAIDEINATGGILKRKLVPVLVDGKSDVKIFSQQAEYLIKEEGVSVIIGCWASAMRKAVKQVVEKYNHLLIYPVSSEGLEESPNILYAGATQNQQLMCSALWSFYNLGKRFFLIGSDDIFSHATHEVIKGTLGAVHAEVLGESYLIAEDTHVEPILDQITQLKPDVIINTLYGSSNLAFFNALRTRGITPEKIPVMTIGSLTETEFAHLGSKAMAGDYAIASYFQSIEREQNRFFVTSFKKKYGTDRVVSESEETGYMSLFVWAQAVAKAGTADSGPVRDHLKNCVVNAPEGIVYVDNKALQMWKMVYVGKLRNDGQFAIVWSSHESIEPLAYPFFKTKMEWEQFELDLYELWGKRWSRTSH